MKPNNLKFFFVLAVLWLCVTSHSGGILAMELTQNSAAPDFSAVDQNGKTHSLADYQGQWLLLYFYPKDDTPGCTKEACTFRDHFSELQGKVAVIGVSHDSADSHDKFASKYKLQFPLLSDPERKIIKTYGANGLLFTKRISYLINPEGKIAKVYPSVSPADHAREVLEDWKALSVMGNKAK